MKFSQDVIDKKLDETIQYFKEQLSAMRVGRGSVQMIEAIKAEVYGQMMPLNQVAGINMVDFSLITVTPWDKANINPIIKAIQSSNLGINPVQDGDIIRLPIPPLTEERRTDYVKLLKQKTEEIKVSIRQIRKDGNDEIDADEKSKNIDEDEATRLRKELQKRIDVANEEVEGLSKEKESILMKV